MAYTARELITQAYNLTNIVSREFQTIDGAKLSLGLSTLNDFLALERIETQYIPYFTKYQFDTVVGQEVYNIPNLLQVETMCFFLSNVRIPMLQKSRDQYFYTGRVEGLTVMPFSFRAERTLGGMDLYLYPYSNIPYSIELMGKFGFDEVANYNVDLSLVYDRFYIVYMKYALADLICEVEGIDTPSNVLNKLQQIRSTTKDTTFPDMTQEGISTYNCGFGNGSIVSAVVQTSMSEGWIP